MFPLHRTYQECAPDVEIAYIGASLTLDCLAPDGYPLVDIHWFLFQTELTSATSEVEITEGGRRLIREPLSTFDSAGLYRCEASNEAGIRRSEDLDITVTGESGEMVRGERRYRLRRQWGIYLEPAMQRSHIHGVRVCVCI